MKASKKGRVNTNKNGFTLPELLIVIGITSLFALMLIPISLSSLQSQTIGDETLNMKSVLRRAAGQAEFQKNDSDHGISFLADSYVLFSGSTYSTRNTTLDEVFDLPSSLTVSGMNEVVFEKGTGIPTTSGTLTIDFQGKQKSISINEYGLVE